jgi:hypothetical protein
MKEMAKISPNRRINEIFKTANLAKNKRMDKRMN